jgi:hypothetical protein
MPMIIFPDQKILLFPFFPSSLQHNKPATIFNVDWLLLPAPVDAILGRP